MGAQWEAVSVDARIDRLLDEASSIRDLNTGKGHSDAIFLAWRKRAEAAVAEKLGSKSEFADELRSLRFSYRPVIWTEGTVISAQDNQASFDRGLNTALGILKAARESTALVTSTSDTPLVHIEQVGPTATANAQAVVRIEVDTVQLRQLIAGASELSSEERGAAIAAIPDDGEGLNLDQVDKLLSIATKSKELLAGVLGWVLTHSHQLHF
jgi:hypothetical protein